MSSFDRDVLEAASRQKEVNLTTVGRKSAKPHRVTIWLVTAGQRLFIRSGEGLRRHWPQNLIARGEGELQLGKLRIKFKPRLVTDPAEARAVSGLYKPKYGVFVRASKPNQPLTSGEQATFELIPADS
ncbi:MAG: nitroreductase/quinone reductase family protein [Candidatus Dormibacteraeota bacterium]|nr:nitroreductase/quinone reductase family protein [Candidatus Dormibacteraeota bacterium]